MKPHDPYETLKELDDIFHRIMNKMLKIESTPRTFGTSFLLFPSEIHTIEAIGDNPGINVTDLASYQGVTKGAVSQVISRLIKKKLILKMKDINHKRGVFLKLSHAGEKAFSEHRHFHETIHTPLFQLISKATPENIGFVLTLFEAIEAFCNRMLAEDPSADQGSN